ncbi:hypothetical protein [Wielerella bovis]|uniref:hypothetical protein n=1 Tax=Wielerella bovis TaxID=2917790 RepID=UPI002018C997|nr:hypothetical protein [Wielerella bovis]ULJ61340.1 hypothetical protein MIS44_05725 [Wielerella bovis]
MIKRIILILLLCMHAACTSVIWNGGIYDADRAIDTENITQHTENDMIVGVSVVTETPNEPLSGRLVLQGVRYWYAVRADVSRDLTHILQTKLPRQYRIVAPYSGNVLRQLPVVVQDKYQFHSDFCLDYRVRANEPNSAQTLRAMGFQQQIADTHWRKCFALVGDVYAKPDYAAQKVQVLTQRIPVALTMKSMQTKVQPEKLARNVLLTPLGLAIDVMGGAIMLPILIIGDLL